MLHKWQHPDIWVAADKVLFDWSATAPKDGGYHKCDFVVEYEDGEKYTGRFDLYYHSVEYPNLAKHMFDFVRFTSGKYKGALAQEEYDRFKEHAHFKKLAPEFAKFLDKYEIGAYNLTSFKAKVEEKEKGWKDFYKDNRVQATIDSINYRIVHRNVSESEQQRLHDSLKTDFKDLVDYQNLQSWGFASGLLAQNEAQHLYRLYGGEAPSADKWDKLSLAEKVAATRMADELLGVKLKKSGYSPRTLPDIAKDVPLLSQTKLQHRGTDPEAIKVAERFGLSFDGMQAHQYQFTVQRPPGAKGITFYVKRLSDVEGRLKEKLKDFDISTQKKGAYLGGWKPTDPAIYTDFGLRSLFIVQVLPWPEEKGERFQVKYATHDRSMGSVRAKIVDTSLVDWDFPRPPRLPDYHKVGTEHYYHYTNLYRDIHDLINNQAKVLHKHVLDKTVSDLKKHRGWKQLEQRGLTGPGKIDLSKGKMIEIPVGGKFPLQNAALRRLGEYKIIHTHDDGDLTVLVGGKQYIVATTGEVYVHTGHLARKGGNGDRDDDFQIKTGDPIPRFYKDKEYIGVKVNYPFRQLPVDDPYKVKSIYIKQFRGRPYNVFEFSEYHDYTPEQWQKLVKQLEADASKFNMELINERGYAYLVPKWTHQKSSQTYPDEPKRRPKQEGDLELIPDSPEFVAQTVQDSGWRERLDEEFQAAIERTR